VISNDRRSERVARRSAGPSHNDVSMAAGCVKKRGYVESRPPDAAAGNTGSNAHKVAAGVSSQGLNVSTTNYFLKIADTENTILRQMATHSDQCVAQHGTRNHG
jgi:hypothetical protein